MLQRNRRYFFLSSAQIAAAFACLVACGDDGESDIVNGGLSLGTIAVVNGTNYRLNGATFLVSGGPEVVTMSQPNPPQPVSLQAALAPGQYSVELQDGWAVEREMAGTFEAVDETTVTTMNPSTVNIVRGQVLSVGFVFDADGVMVDFTQDDDGNDQSYD